MVFAASQSKAASSPRRRLAIIVLLVALVPAALSAQQAVEPEVQAHLDTASAALIGGDYDAAIKAYRKADKASGAKCLVCQAGLAMAYNRTTRYDKAARAARQALRMAEAPAHKRAAHVELGFSLFQDSLGEDLEKLDEAIEQFRAALRYEEQADQVTLLLGQALLARGSHADTPVARHGELFDEMVALMRAFLAVDPTRPGAARARDLLCGSPDCEPAVYAHDRASERPRDQAHVESLTNAPGVEAPRAISAPAPRYTERARKARVQGTVIVQAIVDKTGGIRDVQVLRGLPLGLTEQAVMAMRQWRFEPARKKGEALDVYYNLTVNFRLP